MKLAAPEFGAFMLRIVIVMFPWLIVLFVIIKLSFLVLSV